MAFLLVKIPHRHAGVANKGVFIWEKNGAGMNVVLQIRGQEYSDNACRA